MTLRNRFKPANTSVKNFRTFKTMDPVIEQGLREFILGLPKDMPFEERDQQIHFMKEAFMQYGPLIKKCGDNPLLFEKLQQQMSSVLKSGSIEDLITLNEQLDSGKKSDPVISSFTWSDIRTALSAIFPQAMLVVSVASLAGPAAAQTIKEHTGIPSGGEDMCAGISRCIQGFLSNSDGELLAQYNRFMENVNLKFDGAVHWELTECMDAAKLAQAAKDAIGSSLNTTGAKSSCQAVSGIIEDTYRIKSDAIFNMATQGACSDYTVNFMNKVNECNVPLNYVGREWLIGLSVVGSLAALVCVGIGVSCCVVGADKACKKVRACC